MADDTAQQVADALSEEGGASAPGGRSKPILRILLAVGVVVFFSGAGYRVSRLVRGPAGPVEPTEEDLPTGRSSEAAEDARQEYLYYAVPAITATLNTARRERYIRVEIKLAIKPEEYDAPVEQVEKKQPELISWLYVYFGGCTLDDVGGDKSLNRILRVIEDKFNDRLWPDRKPLFHHVVVGTVVIQ